MTSAILERPTPVAESTQEERLARMLLNKDIKRVKLEVNEKGHIMIDKDKHPDLYDWAVNG